MSFASVFQVDACLFGVCDVKATEPVEVFVLETTLEPRCTNCGQAGRMPGSSAKQQTVRVALNRCVYGASQGHRAYILAQGPSLTQTRAQIEKVCCVALAP